MRILKIILLTLLVLVVLALVASLILPKKYNVERSIVIDAPVELVKQQSIRWSNFHEWSPWSELDPDMKYTYEGEEGTVGSKASWDGNKDAGKGSQEIVAMTDERVDLKLAFEEPFESEADTYFLFNEVEGGTEVSWGMSGEMPWPFNLMTFYMKSNIGKDYEKGLNSLKERCEQLVADNVIDGYYIQQMEISPRVYVGRRAVMKFDQVAEFMENTIPAAMAGVIQSGQNPIGMPSGLFFTWDPENMETDAFFGVPCESDPNLPDFVSIPVSGLGYYIDHLGPYGETAAAHEAMEKFLEKNQIDDIDIAIEEYVTDTSVQPDPSKWLTRIIYLNNQSN